MRSAHIKDTFRELWKNKGRFLAIFAIIALGTGFFAGVKVTSPDMKLTADTYFEDYNLMDIHLVSTYGFNSDDISAVRDSTGIRGMMPAHSMDAIIKTNNEDKVAKVHSIPLDKVKSSDNEYINRVRLIEGRLPQKSGECVVEKGKIGGADLELGERVVLNTGKEDKSISDYLKNDTFTVVGYVETPYYLTFEKGTSSLGNGTVSVYVMIPEEDFNMDVFTDIFLTLKSTDGLSPFTVDYENAVAAEKEKLEGIAAMREQKRYDEAKPKWYVTDRTNNPGYSSYSDDARRIDAISTIFPVFFFIVAAFVCLTTMTRMVEEQRIQIGTLKALGYGNLAIASKYLVYAAIASVAGSALGLSVGLKLFPFVITNAYSMLYRLPPTIMPFRSDYIILITLGALACTSLAVYLACYKELLESPSALMRPKAPKMGKRVLLERVPFIWPRLKFFSKVTIRNLFRYKKRMVMTLLGVAGCTALMLSGFGLRDAISSIVPKQYEDIFKFNSIIIIDENAKEQDKNDVIKTLRSNADIDDLLNVRFKNYEAGYEGDWQKINLMVPELTDKIDKFISLHEMSGKKPVNISDEGVVIGEKLAEVLNLEAGDEMTIKNGDFTNVKVKVAAINENYTLHYVYMSPALYEKVFGEKFVSNCVLVKTKEDSPQTDEKISSELIDNKAVLQMSFTRDNRKNFSDMVGNLGSVVFVLIVSAGALAFVVLYNLTNINITERIREIASIKVLGFYDLEVSEYVFRENIILTLINTVLGLLGGIVLNKFVLRTAEIDMIMFGRQIYWYSYVAAAALTVAFSALVNVVMHFRLKKISMIESLKSVE